MLYPTGQEWTDWGIADEVHQFFCLHWTELFDPETPDTWQVRSCNVKTILRELIDASRIADGFDAYRGVMRSILDEAFAVVKRDAILEHFYPFVSAYLEPWRNKDIGEKAVPEIERLARVVLGNLEGYWENGVKLVRSQLEKANKRNKKELYAATMNLGIETVARGRSPNHIRDAFGTVVLTKSGKTFLQRFDALFAEFSTLKRTYKCVFLTEGIRQKDEEGLPSDITLVKGRPATPAVETAPPVVAPVPPAAEAPVAAPGSVAKALDPAEEFYKKAPKDGISLTLQVEAADPEAARHQAEKRLGELFAAKNLFSMEDRFGIKVQTSLVEDEAGNRTIVGHRRLGSHYLGTYDARVLKVDLLFRVQEHLQKVAPSDASQLAAAIEYHRLALLATSDEARLVNLWIGLEALCQGGEGSIIERVWSKVAPCVAIDNVRRTLVSLSIFLRKLWKDDNNADFLALFPNSSKDHLKPDDLARVLLLPGGHHDQKKLCKLCEKHQLILHRLFRAQSMMLSRPSSVRENIEYTRQNVEWQIKRLYRARNAIVHTGSSNLLLQQLTQHLHCYLVKTIHSILTDLDRQPLWTIRDSLEHRLKLFEHVVGLFGGTEGHKISLASILDPEACLLVQTEPFAWQPPPAAETAPAGGPAAPGVEVVPAVATQEVAPPLNAAPAVEAVPAPAKPEEGGVG